MQADDVKFSQDLTNIFDSYLKNKKVDVFWDTV